MIYQNISQMKSWQGQRTTPQVATADKWLNALCMQCHNPSWGSVNYFSKSKIRKRELGMSSHLFKESSVILFMQKLKGDKKKKKTILFSFFLTDLHPKPEQYLPWSIFILLTFTLNFQMVMSNHHFRLRSNKYRCVETKLVICRFSQS